MCSTYGVCGKNHSPRWRVSKKKRNRKGQFVRNPILLKIFFGVVGVYAVSLIGINTIWAGLKSLESVFEVENTQAEEVITITWQDEVRYLLGSYGVDVNKAWALATCESSLNPEEFHYNRDGSIDRGLWMINSKYHSEVDKNCAYDPGCSTMEFIRIQKERGWNEWVAYGNTCYEREYNKLINE